MNAIGLKTKNLKNVKNIHSWLQGDANFAAYAVTYFYIMY